MKPTNASVFIFDDEELFTRSFSRQMRKAGFIVHSATKKIGAYSLIGKNCYDAFCIDIETPWSLNFGEELIGKIRTKCPDAYVEIVTAHGKYRKYLNSIGANDITIKPFDVPKYASKLENILEKNHRKMNKLNENIVDQYTVEAAHILNSSKEVRDIFNNVLSQEIPSIANSVVRVKELTNLVDSIQHRISDTMNYRSKLFDEIKNYEE